jgi:hypothetical protein
MLQKLIFDVAYVAIAIYGCCKSIFKLFHMFQTFVSNVTSSCSKADLGVAYVAVATHMFLSACFKCFICFGLMLQMFYLDVSKVDRVLQAAVRLPLLLRRRHGSRACASGPTDTSAAHIHRRDK